MGKAISFEPRVGKAQTGQTSGGFAVIIPIYIYIPIDSFFLEEIIDIVGCDLCNIILV